MPDAPANSESGAADRLIFFPMRSSHGFGLSIPIFVVTRQAWLLWIAGPLLVGRISKKRA